MSGERQTIRELQRGCSGSPGLRSAPAGGRQPDKRTRIVSSGSITRVIGRMARGARRGAPRTTVSAIRISGSRGPSTPTAGSRRRLNGTRSRSSTAGYAPALCLPFAISRTDSPSLLVCHVALICLIGSLVFRSKFQRVTYPVARLYWDNARSRSRSHHDETARRSRARKHKCQVLHRPGHLPRKPVLARNRSETRYGPLGSC
jgi:hypothetical protein